jgi:hypothetical protein
MAKIHRITWIACALTIASPLHAQTDRDLGSVIAEIDQGFVCPQFRPDDAARRADMLAFSRAIASVGPTRISYRQAAYIHARMLERHNCAQRTSVANAGAELTPAGPAPIAASLPAETPSPD